MYEWQIIHPKFDSKTTIVVPKSVTVNLMINMYSQKLRNTADVLSKLNQQLTYSFVDNQHPSVLCFENGIVDLKTGRLLGPAPPDMVITQSVPRLYDPTVDTAPINDMMHSFFPEASYPGESDTILEFYKRWCGYSITGELNLQKALFITGRGANGKSVLSTFSMHAWGNELTRSVDMCHFQQGVGANNDDIFNSRNVRSIVISENSDNQKVTLFTLLYRYSIDSPQILCRQPIDTL